MPLAELVGRAKPRWHIERKYPDLKQKVSHGNCEGRGWHDFHHHTLERSTACYAECMERDGLLLQGLPSLTTKTMESRMETKQQELEARIVAIEYALQVVVNCLSDRASLDRAKLLRLLHAAAAESNANASNSSVPAALTSLANRL
jgi:hypothetical protein